MANTTLQELPYSEEAHKLFHEGAEALAIVENAGMKIDVSYLKKTQERLKRRKRRLEKRMKNSDVGKTWTKHYGRETNYNSPDQLTTILFDVMGFEPTEKTEKGNYKTGKDDLESIDIPFVEWLTKLKKLDKAEGTYLKGILRETVDGFLHPFFDLHKANTFRSSSSNINFQNIPIRDEKIGKMIRKAFLPRDGNRHLVELDYSSLEVTIAAAYHEDPTMIKYLEDPKSDMHRDMAMECFLLPEEEITKKLRYCGKNQFVFPQFYGDWYLSNTQYLWKSITEEDLKTASGKSVKRHLREKGIKSKGACDYNEDPVKGTFENHMKNVEKFFWNERFPVYKQWKEDWYNEYLAKGWFQSKTGFICKGPMKKNEVINYPVQGSAFHCLLWVVNELVLRELKNTGLDAIIVGQIHDSIVADVANKDLLEFAKLVKDVAENRIMEAWDWISVPLHIDLEVAPPGEPWANKKELTIDELADEINEERDFRKIEVGCREWLQYWEDHPELQDEMIEHKQTVKNN